MMGAIPMFVPTVTGGTRMIRKRMIPMLLVLILSVGVLTLAGCSKASSSSGSGDAEAIMESACGPCHSTDFLYKQSSDLDWEKTVDRMIKQRGADVSDADRPVLIEHLEAKTAGN